MNIINYSVGAGIVMVVLKISGVFNISWFWVLLPTLFPVFLVAIIIIYTQFILSFLVDVKNFKTVRKLKKELRAINAKLRHN